MVQRLHEPLRELEIGDERDIEIHGLPPDEVIVVQLLLLDVLGDVDDEVHLLFGDVAQGVGLLLLQGPVQDLGRDPVLLHEPCRAPGRVELEVHLVKFPEVVQEVGLALDGAS